MVSDLGQDGPLSYIGSDHSLPLIPQQMTTRTFLCWSLRADCPSCHSQIAKVQTLNSMYCYTCQQEWCWICRKSTTNQHSVFGKNHFAPYNVLGCPGLRYTPSNFIVTLLCNVMVLLLMPFILLYTPLVMLLGTFPE